MISTENLTGSHRTFLDRDPGGQIRTLVEKSILAKLKSRVDLAERLIATLLFGDVAAVGYALILSFWLRFRTGLREVGVESDVRFADYTGYIIVGSISLIGVLAYLKLYDRQLLLRFRRGLLIIGKGVLLWLAAFLPVSLLLKFSPPISRGYVILAGEVSIAFLCCWRFVFHQFLIRSAASARLRQRVLLVGWNAEAERLAANLATDAQSAYEIVGCVSAGTNDTCQHRPAKVENLGGVNDIPALLENRMIDMVILSDVDCMSGEIIQLANLCEREMIQFKIMPTYFQILVSGLQLELLNSAPVLGVSQLPLNRLPSIILKRACDILGATLGLALAAPLIFLFGALVWFESSGPIFYRQRRLGRRGSLFNILKIRTMRVDAEKDNEPGWTTKNDPRRLRIGAFLRRWNIDELPQFWNVLKGDMSLVGPRPERPELIRSFRDEIPHYNARHNVKPGMTGWAQVKGYRGDTDLVERINCDLYYLENWNVFFDFQIMVMTFLNHRNAY